MGAVIPLFRGTRRGRLPSWKCPLHWWGRRCSACWRSRTLGEEGEKKRDSIWSLGSQIKIRQFDISTTHRSWFHLKKWVWKWSITLTNIWIYIERLILIILFFFLFVLDCSGAAFGESLTKIYRTPKNNIFKPLVLSRHCFAGPSADLNDKNGLRGWVNNWMQMLSSTLGR